MSDYCHVAKSILRQHPVPYKTFICDIVELVEYPGIVFLMMYAANLAEFSDYQIANITEWLNSIKKILNGHPLISAKYAHRISQEDPKQLVF